MALLTERTTFTLDVLGRYTANTWQEILDSQDQTLDSHARPFDVFILGGGTFGPAIASRMFTNDHTRARRILLIEAGPLALPEHVQNLPSLGTDEVWGVPWNSDSPQPQDRIFPGLAFSLGGRSVFWGGWSPHFLPEEIPTPPWPTSVRDDLLNPVLTIPDAGGVRTLSYLDLAAEQIGAANPNDFISGALHGAMRDRQFAGLTGRPAGGTTLTGSRGALANQGQLEAPLGVESTSPRPGFLPFNKFSVVPLLVRVSRLAQDESVLPNNVRKRFVVVDNTHVIGLEVAGDRITRIRTSRGNLDVPANGLVFLGLGTIENTRMALNTLDRARGYDPNQLIGRNLMAHMRSNLTFRVPRSAFGAVLDVNLHPETRELQVSALFVKGICDLGGGDTGYFHVQVTASGVGEMARNSELELFKKVPDIDLLHRFQGLTDAWVVVTLRGIGEIRGDRTAATPNRVTTGGPQGRSTSACPGRWSAWTSARPGHGSGGCGTPWTPPATSSPSSSPAAARSSTCPTRPRGRSGRATRRAPTSGATRSAPPTTRPGPCGWATTPPPRSPTASAASMRCATCSRSAPACCPPWAPPTRCCRGWRWPAAPPTGCRWPPRHRRRWRPGSPPCSTGPTPPSPAGSRSVGAPSPWSTG
jgi:hypothetical protein